MLQEIIRATSQSPRGFTRDSTALVVASPGIWPFPRILPIHDRCRANFGKYKVSSMIKKFIQIFTRSTRYSLDIA